VTNRAAQGAVAALTAVSLGILVGAAPAHPGSGGGGGGGGGATITSGPLKNPATSTSPSAAFRRYCFKAGPAVQCNAAALADIDRGRHTDHLGPLRLPKNFATRSAPAQLRALVNQERSARHLPRLSGSSALDTRAQAGAAQGVDPTGPAAYAWASNFSAGYTTPLAADFAWMYDDGPGSPNSACTSAGAAGCWGHRDNILSAWGGDQGTADYVGAHGSVQLTELFVENY
jgi:hypothetical protein